MLEPPHRLLFSVVLALCFTGADAVATAEVEQRKWRGGSAATRSFLASLVAADRPVVITGAPWVASKRSAFAPARWTPRAIAQRGGRRRVKIKYSTTTPTFGLGCCPLHDASVAMLLNETHAAGASSGAAHVYFAGPIAEVEESGVADASGVQAALEAMRLLDVEAAQSKATLWIGSRGSITPCHYDEMHNLFLQLHGAKRFTLWPPSAWRHLYLAPKFDSQHRNVDRAAYRDLSAQRFDRFPALRFAQRAALSVTLRPGELLYLPPLWFHEVQALGRTTISANVWSAARVVAQMNEAWTLALPLRPDVWPIAGTVAVAGHFVRAIVTRALSARRARSGGGGDDHAWSSTRDALGFLATLVETRYAHREKAAGRVGHLAATNAEIAEKEEEEVSSSYESEHRARHARYLERVERESPSFLSQADTTAVVGVGEELGGEAAAAAAVDVGADGGVSDPELEPAAGRGRGRGRPEQRPPPLEEWCGRAAQLSLEGSLAEFDAAELFAAADAIGAQLGATRTSDAGASEIFLANFIEDLAGQVVGYEHVSGFFKNCAAFYG
tara:strand:- start:514 stop:2184 length:1671 start_codon:yes stop_codon:yes gene_type:complete